MEMHVFPDGHWALVGTSATPRPFDPNQSFAQNLQRKPPPPPYSYVMFTQTSPVNYERDTYTVFLVDTPCIHPGFMNQIGSDPREWAKIAVKGVRNCGDPEKVQLGVDFPSVDTDFVFKQRAEFRLLWQNDPVSWLLANLWNFVTRNPTYWSYR